MAAPDALRALQGDAETWRQFRLQSSGKIDLTAAALEGADLSGRDLSDCDFTGALLNGVCLDNCTLECTILNGCDLSFASLVRCRIVHCFANAISLRCAVLRGTMLSDTLLDRADLTDSSLQDCTASACHFLNSLHKGWRVGNSKLVKTQMIGAVLDGAYLDNLTADDCRFLRISGKQVTLSSLRFTNSELDQFMLVQSQIGHSALLHSRIRCLELVESTAKNLDFSHSILFSIDLAAVSLSSATMQETTFVDCRFPAQVGKVSWSGVYRPSPDLMRQPVQDTKGLPARLRREIADAQFVYETHEQAQGILSRVGLRLWGSSCSFGQSLSRLGAFTFVGCGGIALTGVGIELLSSATQTSYAHLSWQMCMTSLSSLFGVSDVPKTDSTTAEMFVGVAAKIFGFFVLGLWMGLAANKLGKLSSQ